ncbi:uncharacterized protein LOC103840866 [Brassica rapa]|uniref:uncharacterized protein LOC103840866 n=1 Tax=Brassica campestris TaxID=3711 RepID=UPI00142E8956|nr:uncharacterized protein LOC103840866 [Brassica rapa]
MEEGRQKDLQLLEEIIDKGLKEKLLQTIASRLACFRNASLVGLAGTRSLKNKKYCILLFYGYSHLSSDLRKNLETLEENGVNSLKTMVNPGSEVYMQAHVPDTRHTFVDVGLGFYVEFTRQEALDYIPQREERVKKYVNTLLFFSFWLHMLLFSKLLKTMVASV